MTTQTDNIIQALELAVGHHQAGQLSDAEAIYKQVLLADPDNVHANHFLGVIAIQSRKYDLAVQFITKAIAINPAEPSYLVNLGNIRIIQKRPGEAVTSYQKALAINPDDPEALYNLGNALRQLERFDEAAASFQKAIDLKPDYAKAYNGMGVVLRKQGKLDEAVAFYRHALQIAPDYAEAYFNYGNLLLRLGSQDEAIDNFRKALAARPDYSLAHSSLLYALNYQLDTTQEDFFAEAQKWDQQHAQPLAAKQQNHINSKGKNRRLRIGYVSPDFRTHPVSFFFEPFLNTHDRDHFEVYLYSNTMKPDLVSERLQSEADKWIPIIGIGDEDVADLIRQDQIDILVDLAKHTAKNRLLVFAHKPAPVQVTWSGFPNTTGMQAIDYRLVDELTCPKGIADKLNSEKLIRLQHGSFCFQPPEDVPDVTDSPVLKNNYITFGSCNNLLKVNSTVIAVWAEILHKVPGSHLLIIGHEFKQKSARNRFVDLFAGHGIAAERLEIFPFLPPAEFLAMHGRIDIALDPFPYNGHTTSCYNLWMGVPLITLQGEMNPGRVGASILTRIGLPELIAGNQLEYIHKAVALAQDHGRLSSLRSGLRDKILASSLCDITGFTRSIEEAYMNMWDKYIDQDT